MSFRPRCNLTRAGALALGTTLILSLIPMSTSARAATCSQQSAIQVPGAELQRVACLDDVTTAGLVGTDYTNPADWAGLHAKATRNPSGVRGTQVDGYFHDDDTAASNPHNTNHGWNHDAQFVIRLP